LTADHRPRAPEEKDLEFERAVPGSTGLESAFAGALTALDGDLDAVVRALAVGPRDLLSDRAAAAGDPGRSSPRAAGWTLVDTDAVATVRAAEHRSRARNDALDGRELRGVVRACFPAAWVAA
jgi:dihydroorotase